MNQEQIKIIREAVEAMETIEANVITWNNQRPLAELRLTKAETDQVASALCSLKSLLEETQGGEAMGWSSASDKIADGLTTAGIDPVLGAPASDTPRTDKEACGGWYGDAICVSADFARQLERELAEAKATLAKERLNSSNASIRARLALADELAEVLADENQVSYTEEAALKKKTALTNYRTQQEGNK